MSAAFAVRATNAATTRGELASRKPPSASGSVKRNWSASIAPVHGRRADAAPGSAGRFGSFAT